MRELRNVESIRPKKELIFSYSVVDLLFIFFITGMAYLLRGIVYDPFEYIFVGFTVANCIFLFKEPKSNPKKKHVNVMFLSILRVFKKLNAPIRSIDLYEYGKRRDE
ncbi:MULTISPECIES: DUF5592 family protein [unclassified Enterococcus]|uniref:DUF5592 family protein n=1 Tax=unclassified Enterococcus TaxID=2608891 RepID=UPI003F29A656